MSRRSPLVNRSHLRGPALVVRYVLLVLVLVLLLGPLLLPLMAAFKAPGEPVFGQGASLLPTTWSLSAFEYLFANTNMVGYIRNSLVVAILNVVSHLVLATAAGYMLSRRGWRGRTLAVLIVTSAMIFPFESIMVSLYALVRGLGFFDTLVGAWLPAMLGPFHVLLMRAGFLGVPEAIEDAALLDGANEWQRFWNVMLPQTRGALTVVGLTSFIFAWQDYLWPLLVLQSDDKMTMMLGIARLSGDFGTDYRVVLAGAITALVPIALVFFATQRYFFRGIEEGGLKFWAPAPTERTLMGRPEQFEGVEIDDGRVGRAYVTPDDPAVHEALEHWRDLKVGVIIHWGIYSFIGQAGSWSLHREHLGDFTDPPPDFRGTDAEYHDWYFDQARHFSGPDYDPVEWAEACAGAGMRYCVFTAKHHDGFALYDTAYSNTKATAETAGLGRDVFGQTMDAMRAAGLETGVYFSKADWNHPGYWDRARPITDRFCNYDITARPRAWASFVEYTHAQIEELLANYGRMNVLWLDAGWVRPPAEPIDMDAIVARARELQPGIIVVDRTVGGEHENYRTPEQLIPEEVLDEPWESCVPMTRRWCSTQVDDPAKPTAEIVANLVRIVARGGNYLIGIGPDATGRLSRPVAQGLAELGAWLAACGAGIYGSRPPTTPIPIEAEGEWHATTRDGRLYLFGLGDARDVRVGVRVREARVLGGGEVQCIADGDGTILRVDHPRTLFATGIELIAEA